MASPRNPKSEALESYWEEASPTANSMSTLLRSLPTRGLESASGLESMSPVPPPPVSAPPVPSQPSKGSGDSDAILDMCRRLASVTAGWTLAEIVQNTPLSAAAAISAVKDAVSLGLVAESSEDPSVKRFRVTPVGAALLQS
jgi:hypothetical protein